MAGITISNGSSSKSYLVTSKSNTLQKPYLKIASDQFLPLTSETTTGLQLKIEREGRTYIPIELKQSFIEYDNRMNQVQYYQNSSYSATGSIQVQNYYSGELTRTTSSTDTYWNSGGITFSMDNADEIYSYDNLRTYSYSDGTTRSEVYSTMSGFSTLERAYVYASLSGNGLTTTEYIYDTETNMTWGSKQSTSISIFSNDRGITVFNGQTTSAFSLYSNGNSENNYFAVNYETSVNITK